MRAFTLLLASAFLLATASAEFCHSGRGGVVANPCASDGSDYCCDCECKTCGPAEYCAIATGGSDCGICNPSFTGGSICATHATHCTSPPPPSPSPPPPSPPTTFAFLDTSVCKEEFLRAYDREACEENITQLPIDLFVGGAIVVLLALLPLNFYGGLLRRRWRRAGGDECPFLGGAATNQCRSCKTLVSDKAFVRNCSMTTSSTHGNVTTYTTHTTSNWNHCVGCHYLKCSAFNALILAMMSVMWAVTVVERTLSVFAIAPYVRDERVNTFGLIPYWLTAFVGLMQLAILWCNRKPLGKWSTIVPCGCCCRPSPAAKSKPPAKIQIVMGPRGTVL